MSLKEVAQVCERMWDNLLREGFEVAFHETNVGLQQGDREADL